MFTTSLSFPVLESTFFQLFCKSIEDAVCTWLIFFSSQKSCHEILLEVFGCWRSLTVSFKVLPGDYLHAVGFSRNTSGAPEAALGVWGWVLGRERVASGGHPCPSLLGQP